MRSGFLAGLLTASGMLVSMLPIAATAHADTPPATPAGAQPTGLQAAEITAAAQARATGKPVPVGAATDPYSTLTAQPDGTFTGEVSAAPERVKADGAWVSLDPTLHRNADGTYSTAATTAALTLSGGGNTPLAAMDDAGRKLAFSWPTALPKPQVSGATALYPEVLPGVDLSVVASEQGGFSDTIIVKNAQAAQNPALATLNLATSGTDVSLATDSAGNITATDSAGHVIYHAPAPVMWDSSTDTAAAPSAKPSASGSASGSASASTSKARAAAAADPADSATAPTSSTAGPGADAQVAPVGVRVRAGSMTLTPEEGLLTAADTAYPVYIDPSYTPVWVSAASTTGDYTYIQQGYPGTANWKRSDDTDKNGLGVGYQGYSSPTGIERTIYQWNLGTAIDSKNIHGAVLNVSETASASWGCESYSVHAYTMSSHIGSGTTWSNYNAAGRTLLDTQSVGGAYNADCAGATPANFNVTSALANDTDGVLTIELTGDEGNSTAFKRFAKSAKLSYTYNTTPSIPTGPSVSPAPKSPASQGCDSTGPWGYIASGGAGGYVTLSGKVADPDSSSGQLVRGQFGLWDDSTAGGSTDIISIGYAAGGSQGTMDSNADSGWQTSGSTATRRIPTSKLTDGHLYGWELRSDDGINHSGNTAVCHFRYDATAPTGITVNGTAVTGGSCVDAGTLSGAATFTLGATDSGSGLDHFDYTLGAASDLAGDGGTHQAAGQAFTVPAASWGSYFLSAAAVDKAGNESAAVCYTFYVPDNPAAQVTPGDIDGDGFRDFAAISNSTYSGPLTGLRYYPTNARNSTARIASDNTNGPNANGTWDGALIAHRSTPERSATGTKTDDMWALGTDKHLYLYRNNVNSATGTAGHQGQIYSSDQRVTLDRPDCDPAVADCSLYTTSWAQVQQIIAPGDMNGDGVPDLIARESSNLLWFFPGTPSGAAFGSPQLLGHGGWDNYTVLAPGNTAGDGGVAAMWARDDTTGALWQYPATLTAGKVTFAPRVQIGANFTAAAYPLMTSVGDINGGGSAPDLIATTSGSKLVDQLGPATTSATGFDGTPGKPAVFGASGWSTVSIIS